MGPMALIAGALLLMLMGRGGSAAVHMSEAGGTAPNGKVLPPIPPVGGELPKGGERHASTSAVFDGAGSPGDSSLGLPPSVEMLQLQAGLEDSKKRPFYPQSKYIAALWHREQQYKASPVRTSYSIPRLKQITIAASCYFGVPPSWTYGLLQGESNFFPIGIFAGYKNSDSYAIARKSSAYGMGQMLRGRWKNSERPAWLRAGGPSSTFHYQFLDPKIAIWVVASSVGRLVGQARGGGWGKSIEDQMYGIYRASRGNRLPSGQGSLAVGHWWAGTYATKGATAKVKDILAYGRDVWSEKMRPKSSWHKTAPGVQPADSLPPWRTGSLTPSQATTMLNLALVLEGAGQELFDLNSGLLS